MATESLAAALHPESSLPRRGLKAMDLFHCVAYGMAEIELPPLARLPLVPRDDPDL